MKREHEIEGKLPAEYKRLEYLEANGTQWINTTYVPNSITCMFADAQFLNTTEKNLSAVRWSQSPTYDTIGIYKGAGRDLHFYLGRYNSGEIFSYSNFNNSTQRFTAEIRSDGCCFNKQLVSTKHVGTISNTLELPLFGFNNQGTVNCGAGVRVFEYYLEEEGELKRWFVPAICLSDNKPGMYDLCGSICPLTNSPFYINSGTGEFLYN